MAARQIVAAFPWGNVTRYLLRDRDSIYGAHFRHRVKNMGIEEVLISPQSPWQNPYCERLVGTIRHECTDHIIVLGERHLRRTRFSFLRYYHGFRTHLPLGMDTPNHRPIQTRECGDVVEISEVGDLHHHYKRRAA